MTKDEFFDKIVFGQIEHDLENMLNINPLVEYGSLNYPLINSVVNYILFFGTLLNGSDAREPVKYINNYIEICMNEYIKEIDSEILWSFIRNGCSHDYFSRIGISKEIDNSKIAYVDFNNKIIVNSYSLTNAFIKSLAKFKETLSENTFNSRIIEIKKYVESEENDEMLNNYRIKLRNLHSNILYYPKSSASLNPYLNQN